MKTLYVDLDGVLFDFDKRLKEIFDNIVPTNKEILWKELEKHQHLYADLEIYPEALKFWNQLLIIKDLHNYSLCILAAIPRRTTMPYATQDKMDSVKKHFGDVDFKIGPYAKDKQKHCKPGDILIDDKLENIEDWNSKDGFGIHHKNFTQSLVELIRIVNE